MALRLRTARRHLRDSLLRCKELGKDDPDTMLKLTAEIMGHEVSIDEVMGRFYRDELATALKELESG